MLANMRPRLARRVSLALLCVAGLAQAEAPGPGDSAVAAQRLRDTLATRALAWRAAAADERPVFHGVVSYDAAGGGAGAMMYPAPSAIGLLAAILTHAAINGGARSAETKRIEEAADKVLVPLQDSIDKLLMRNLQQAALEQLDLGTNRRLATGGEGVDDAWLVETQPVFLLTQDRRALVVEAVVRVFDGSAKTPAVERAVRAVSPPVKGDDAEAYWRDAQGRRLAQTGAALLADAIRAAVADAQAPADLPQRTVRYVEGSADKFERAMPLSERCGRVALRTLRGGVMSVPARPKTAAADADGAPVACGALWPEAAPPAAGGTATADAATVGLNAASADGVPPPSAPR